MELCAVEAVTNAIKHAYRGAGGHEVSVEVSFTRERLDLDVRDQGMSMPAAQALKLRSGSQVFDFDPSDLEAIPEGGMGLEIIRREMARHPIRRRVDSIVCRLTKFLRPSESVEAAG